MPRRFIKKHVPSTETILKHPLLRPLRHLISDLEVWHLHRRSVSGACFIGLFCAFLPLPGQTVVAAALAIGFRCNLPISIALVWITNPLTIGPIFFFAYRLGAWLLEVEVTITKWELSWDAIAVQLSAIWWPLITGSLVCGWVSGISSMVTARLMWRLHVVRRWRQRSFKTPS
jgi:uncharacterized protein (DUF2062 family)